MNVAAPEPLLRGAAAALAFAAAFALLLRRPRDAATACAAFCSAGVGAFVLVSWHAAFLALGPAAFVLDAWCLASPFAFWLLARALFDDGFRMRRAVLAGFALLAIGSAGADWGRFALGPLGSDPAFAQSAFLALRAAAAVLLVDALLRVALGWRADLVESRRRARAWAIAIVGAVFALTVSSSFVFPDGAPDSIRAPAIAVLAAAMFAWMQLVASGALAGTFARTAAPAGLPRPRAIEGTVDADRALAARVTALMEREGAWRQERLTLGALARRLDVPEYRLRRAIHRQLGARNFNAFLAAYRLQAAAARLADAVHGGESVLEIALDSGFASIGPFNRAFKARYGVTPMQYRVTRLAESSNAGPVHESGETAAR